MHDPSGPPPSPPDPAGDQATGCWRFDSRLEQAHAAAARVRAFCGAHGLGGAGLLGIELCLYEAFANVVEHAYGNQPGHEVRVSVTMTAAGLALTVCQRGVPLDPAVVAAVPVGFHDLPAEPVLRDFALRGRGLRIIKVSIAECKVHRDGDWHCLAMRQPWG